MGRRIVAIGVIFAGASLAWFILGGTLQVRTDQSSDRQTQNLTAQWGSAQVQTAPLVIAHIPAGRTFRDAALPIARSHIDVTLDLEQRRKGLLWYNLYDVSFSSHYVVVNTTAASQLQVRFNLPSADGNFTDLVYRVGGRRVTAAQAVGNDVTEVFVPPGQSVSIDVGYRSRGRDSWLYRFGDGVQSENAFDLTMTTNFNAIDFPAQTLLPTAEVRTPNGYRLEWRYGALVTGNGIGMSFPVPMQPGPLAQRITFWAPVALLFYFFVMLVLTTIRKIDLHPVNYFFLAAAFFAFHLLFAYLVDRIPLEVAFCICSIVSIFLTISYLRIVVGWRFAAIESGLAQLIYLVLFSYALFDEGWSGLTITVGAIVTLFAAMQLTARIRWSERIATATEAA
jgi:hypothetical protein